MSFFTTSDGHRHAGRIAGLLYLVGVLPSCLLQCDAKCLAWIAFTAGWWLSFSDKRPARTVAELTSNARRLCGVALLAVALAALFYLAVFD